MRFGFCGHFTDAKTLAENGGDYIEPGVWNDLRPLDGDDAYFGSLQATLRDSGIKAEVFNLMVPGSLRITGPSRNPSALEAYMRIAAKRAAALGGKVLVFGSAGARSVDDSQTYERAWEEIRSFLTATADIVADSGLVIAIESLASAECNIITSVAEAVRLAEEVARPDAVGVLSDLYHVDCDKQSYDETAAAGHWLKHVHIASGPDRHSPTEADFDALTAYLSAVRKSGYDERISVEGHIPDFSEAVAQSIPVLRRAWAAA